MSTIPAATATPVLAASTGLARELRAMLALALPLVVTQLLQILVNTTEVVLLGWLDARASGQRLNGSGRT